MWILWPSLITWLTLLLLIWVATVVGRARVRYGVRAPATTGHEQFERAFRVQMNTLENVILFLPALWLAARFWSPQWAAVCGLLWLAGRVWYGRAYLRDPATRSAGFGLSSMAAVILLLAAAVGWIRTMLLV